MHMDPTRPVALVDNEDRTKSLPGQNLTPADGVRVATAPQVQTQPPSDVSRTAELVEVLKAYEGKRLAIFIKGFPDPDSIASAIAHQFICRGLGVNADIYHFEDLSHHENRALVKTLEIEMAKWDVNTEFDAYAGYCCVDTQSGDLPIPIPDHFKMVSLVDHHKASGSVVGEFIDVREDAGSASAIYAEYLAEGAVSIEERTKELTLMATALMYGIRSDTDDFLIARPIDFKGSAYLSPLCDREVLAVISQQSISSKSMDILQVALDRKVIKGTYLIAGVGYVREEDRDGIGEAADYLLRREGVDTVLIYGVVGAHTIDGSLRTTSHTVDPDKWMKDLFGYDTTGRYYGGGRRDKGGFQIPLSIFSRCSDRELLWQVVSTTVEDILFEKIGTTRDSV